MVLFKRKPIRYLAHPRIDDQESDVWVISESNEIFTSYDAYLERMDFFKSKKFTCEVSGRSGLTYFDALRSEQAGSREIDEAFPQALREPVLRRVQFSTTSRIDILVEEVFNDFKNDFYPGELVTIFLEDGSRFNGRVRDKARFAEIRSPGGTMVRDGFSRYFVRLIDRPREEALVDDNHIFRDRKVFTKQMLRSFIKNTVTREGWNGAPWIVKPEIAERFRIDTNIPPHLLHSTKAATKKAGKKSQVNTEDSEQDGMFGVWQPHRLPELKPAPKGKKGQSHTMQVTTSYEQQQQQQQPQQPVSRGYFDNYVPPPVINIYPQKPIPYLYHPVYYPWPNHDGVPKYSGTYDAPPTQQAPTTQLPLPIPPPPPIKYPMEDLDVEPMRDGTHRPNLKFITKKHTKGGKSNENVVPGLKEETVGLLLETWNTLNVYCQIIKLDSFTFDDFVEAMQFSSVDGDCELFVESHCAILKQLVNAENNDEGAIQISLPDLPDSDDEEEESEGEESKPPTPTPEPEYPAKRTRSSLNKVQFAEPPKEEEEKPILTHRAAEMFTDYGWIDRLRKRDFRNGGWELIMVGLLHQVAGRPRLTDVCNDILSHLAPLDADATVETVQIQYSTMDINLRTQALQIICQLFLETKTVKTFLEDMSNTMTHYRKLKIEHQRGRKEALSRLKELQIERRLLAPEPEKSPSPIAELESAMEAEKTENEDGDISIPDSEDEPPMVTRSLRRGSDRAAERKRKREEEQERKEKAAEAKQNKGSKEYQKVLKQIEKEREKIEDFVEQILVVDSDLREADCPRTRMLGKDRFCNRYWWFEKNAMPYGGLPDSSTADAEYANGRIWVQGPDDMEYQGFIDVNDEDKQGYYRRFQMTPAERKKKEEGPTSLKSATQWAFYDTAEDLDMLIGWLDSRGNRELKLKKELNLHRDVIIKHMEKRAAYLAPREVEVEEAPIRMSTRTKTYASDKAYRCLQWRNTTAMSELGHLHIDPPPKPRSRGGKKNATHNESTTTRNSQSATLPVLNRQGKLVTRQGSRYHF